MEIIKD